MKNKVVALVAMAWLALSVEPAHAITNSLGTTYLLESPAAGSDSVVLADATPWTATTNASWLHLSAANQSGTGSTFEDMKQPRSYEGLRWKEISSWANSYLVIIPRKEAGICRGGRVQNRRFGGKAAVSLKILFVRLHQKTINRQMRKLQLQLSPGNQYAVCKCV